MFVTIEYPHVAVILNSLVNHYMCSILYLNIVQQSEHECQY